MENLISTTDFNILLSEWLYTNQINQRQYVDKAVKYAKLLKRPIEKNMFVPCLPDGDIFQTPTSCSKSCSPIDFCEGGKCDINGCYTEHGRYEEACKTVLFEDWFGFDNSLSKAETGVRNEVTNDKGIIYFIKDKSPIYVNEQGFAFGIIVKTIEDLLRVGIKFKLSENFKKIIGL